MDILKDTWYSSWFDTPYYHMLYKDRDYEEAKLFMTNLVEFLKLPNGAKILDLACGRGRHSIFLNKMGYDVTGIDLSPNSIAHAKAYENEHLRFKVHDMTQPYPDTFDAIVNLFTSFGYFDDDSCNLKTITAIKEALKPHGFGVIDFMNVNYVINHLVKEDTKIQEGITFKQRRVLENGYILKHISFTHNYKDYRFTERVKALQLDDFKRFFKEAQIKLLHTFGSYQLDPFDKETSTRLILIFKK